MVSYVRIPNCLNQVVQIIFRRFWLKRRRQDGKSTYRRTRLFFKPYLWILCNRSKRNFLDMEFTTVQKETCKMHQFLWKAQKCWRQQNFQNFKYLPRLEFLHCICNRRFLYKNVPYELQKRWFYNQKEIAKRKRPITRYHKRSDAIERPVPHEVRCLRRGRWLCSWNQSLILRFSF